MEHYLWWVLGGVALAWGASLLIVRHWTRKKLLEALNQEEGVGEDLRIQVEGGRPEDLQALEVVRAHRRRLLVNLWPGTALSFAAIADTAQGLIKEVAQVYYPDEDRPELKASLADLVGLYNRVGQRLNGWLNTLPARPFRDMELATAFWLHGTYRQVTNHGAYRFFKRHRLDQAARWVWGAINAANPWYWSRQVIYKGGKEAFARLFLAKVVDLVGEEAIHLYGRRGAKGKGERT